jgi:hypothetical protein
MPSCIQNSRAERIKAQVIGAARECTNSNREYSAPGDPARNVSMPKVLSIEHSLTIHELFMLSNDAALSTDGDCALWSDDVGDFVIILDPGGSRANRDPAAAGPLPGWQPLGRAPMATALRGRTMLGTSLLSLIRADQGRTGIRRLPDRYRGGSRWVGHRWRRRFVVRRCWGLRYYPRSGRIRGEQGSGGCRTATGVAAVGSGTDGDGAATGRAIAKEALWE